MAVGTTDAGEPAARIAAIEVSFNDFLDDGPEEARLLLEAALVFCQETVEVMKQHSIEDGSLGMPRTILDDAAELFPIGAGNRVEMPVKGRLFLGVNELVIGDNAGQFMVTIVTNPE